MWSILQAVLTASVGYLTFFKQLITESTVFKFTFYYSAKLFYPLFLFECSEKVIDSLSSYSFYINKIVNKKKNFV